MNSQSVIRKTIVLTIKRAAFIVVAALLLTPLLHGQHAAADAPAAVSVSPDQQATATTTPETQEEIIARAGRDEKTHRAA